MFENDEEYDNAVGLDENDLRVTHRAAFMTLIPAWDSRIAREDRVDVVAPYTPPVMETAFQHYKASMACWT
jgi:hypothetical protein